jgi:hypothetical protein
MAESLDFVAKHVGSWSDGHYEARFADDGTITIITVFETAGHQYRVQLSPNEWDRLVAWVEWQRKK